MDVITAINTIATVALVALTGVLAYFTCVLSQEARKTREWQQSPDISISIEPLFESVHIMIMNNGNADAKDIEIKAENNFRALRNSKEVQLQDILPQKISYLRKGQFFITDLGKGFELIKRNDNPLFVIAVNYSNFYDKTFTKNIALNVFDMGKFLGFRAQKDANGEIMALMSSLPITGNIIYIPKAQK